jgi:hypothetical protein
MHRKSAKVIVNWLLVGCPPPYMILDQEDCSRLESSWTKEVLHLENDIVFF